MNIEEYREFCLDLPHATESTPFDETTLVMKVGGKMFAYADIVNFNMINVKCDPEVAIELRELYPEVIPGFHCNKKHWNSIITTGSLADEDIKSWIKDSYNLVIAKLPKAVREALAQ